MFGLEIEHNMEVAHRLSKLPGKCENIHGHSMKVRLTIAGPRALDKNDLMDGLDFGSMKRWFRGFIDKEFDHGLLLNADDPLLQQCELPGVKIIDGDPSTENLAKIIGKACRNQFGSASVYQYRLYIQETAVNAAFWEG